MLIRSFKHLSTMALTAYSTITGSAPKTSLNSVVQQSTVEVEEPIHNFHGTVPLLLVEQRDNNSNNNEIENAFDNAFDTSIFSTIVNDIHYGFLETSSTVTDTVLDVVFGTVDTISNVPKMVVDSGLTTVLTEKFNNVHTTMCNKVYEPYPRFATMIKCPKPKSNIMTKFQRIVDNIIRSSSNACITLKAYVDHQSSFLFSSSFFSSNNEEEKEDKMKSESTAEEYNSQLIGWMITEGLNALGCFVMFVCIYYMVGSIMKDLQDIAGWKKTTNNNRRRPVPPRDHDLEEDDFNKACRTLGLLNFVFDGERNIQLENDSGEIDSEGMKRLVNNVCNAMAFSAQTFDEDLKPFVFQQINESRNAILEYLSNMDHYHIKWAQERKSRITATGHHALWQHCNVLGLHDVPTKDITLQLLCKNYELLELKIQMWQPVGYVPGDGSDCDWNRDCLSRCFIAVRDEFCRTAPVPAPEEEEAATEEEEEEEEAAMEEEEEEEEAATEPEPEPEPAVAAAADIFTSSYLNDLDE